MNSSTGRRLFSHAQKPRLLETGVAPGGRGSPGARSSVPRSVVAIRLLSSKGIRSFGRLPNSRGNAALYTARGGSNAGAIEPRIDVRRGVGGRWPGARVRDRRAAAGSHPAERRLAADAGIGAVTSGKRASLPRA